MVGRLTGQSLTRVEDPRILSGQGRYVDDVVLPGMLHAAFVRSTYAHARIAAIDLDDARAAPGVRLVLAGEGLRALADDIVPTPMPGLLAPVFPALARDKVRTVGDPVVLVVADTRALAEDAAELVVVDYEPLPAVVDAEDAMKAGSPLVFDELGTNTVFSSTSRVGDPDRAFAEAVQVFSETFTQHRHANAPMEGHGTIADYSPGTGELEVFASHQNPHALRLQLARLLHLPAHQLRVRCGDIGGAFGQKGHLNREDVAVAAASRFLGRPVKWIEDRNENLLAGGQAREESVTVSAALDAEGIVRALRVRMVLDQGAYPMAGFAAAAITNLVRVMLPAAYRVVHLEFEAAVAVTNKGTYVAYRGPWEVETWVRERMLDVVARATGVDPVEFRLRNLLADDELPGRMCTGPELVGITLRRTLTEAVAHLGYDELLRTQARERARGRHLGIGVACYLEPAPLPPSVMVAMGATAAPRTVQEARVRLEPDGSLTVFTSQQPHGQSHETTLAQLVADQFEVARRQVRVVHGDTRDTPFNLIGTGGSRAATLASGAVIGAAREVRDQVLEVAGRLLEIDPADLELTDGVVTPRGTPARRLALAEVAHAAYSAPGLVFDDAAPGIEVTHAYASGEGTWSQATHCCVVEVDVETGGVKILRYLVVEDCGSMINPAIVDGQIRGGVAQGIGAVLLERSAYDEEGQFLSGTLMDYLLPTALDIPAIEVHHLESEPVADVNFRGVGEGGAIGAPAAVTNAVEDALHPLGVSIREQYLPPARLVELLGLL